MKKLKGYGIKSDGTAVDIDSPNFRIEEYISVALNEVMTYAEFVKAYPDFSFKCKVCGDNPKLNCSVCGIRVEDDKCKNCQELHNFSVVKVDDRGKCEFCGRIVSPKPTSKRTNGGKPHVCGKIAVYDGDRGVLPLCCSICYMPVDTPKKDDISDIPNEHVISDKVSLAVDDILSSLIGKITEVHAQELKDMVLGLVDTCSSKELLDDWETHISQFYGSMFEYGNFELLVSNVRRYINEARKDVLDSIAQGEGWVETKEFYSKILKIK